MRRFGSNDDGTPAVQPAATAQQPSRIEPGMGGGWPGQGGGGSRPAGRPGLADPPGRQPGGRHATPASPQTRPGTQAPSLEARRVPSQAPTPIEVPTPTLPKGGGAISSIAEKFAANPATGTGGMAVPLALSPGRGGFGPELAVSYDSGAGNSVFGVGWSLGLASISRKTDKGLPQYGDDTDTFIVSGFEDLVPKLVESAGEWSRDVVAGPPKRERFVPRVEGAFSRIERVTESDGNVYWEVVSAGNVTSVYGKTASGRVADPDNASRVFRWLLEETRGDKGNVVLYEYKAEDLTGVAGALHEQHRQEGHASFAGRHLKRILYGNKAGVSTPSAPGDFHFEVVFDYGEHDADAPTPTDSGDWDVRLDPFSSYRSGFEIRTYRLCQRVLMFHRFSELSVDPVLVRSTDFSYEQSGAVTYLKSATQKGYIKDGASYDIKALPAVDFDYSRASFDSAVYDLDDDSAAAMPVGTDGRQYQWIDLDGEGVAGVLTQQGPPHGGGALYYKRNLGQGKLAPAWARLQSQPSSARIAQGRGQQLLDITGDGLPDLVDTSGPVRGYHPRSDDGEQLSWEPIRPFATIPNLDWSDPSLRFIDLDGDGLADILISSDRVYTWYPALRKQGYGAPRLAPKLTDEKRGPTVVFSEAEQTVFLADMTGDGLVDLVRIRNGAISYFPNLGYGRFGPLVQMTGAPHFAPPDRYEPARVRLADVDGSGPSDVIYIDERGVHVWFNEAGNALSSPTTLAVFPDHSAISTVDVVDMLGSGTPCLVWSTPLQGKPPRVRYVDLLASTKPHLLTSVVNNLGLETTIRYTTSTRLYLADRAQGIAWATRLPFPVHVVDRVEHDDKISKLRFVSTYRYRHGYYDPEEREFRGFGYVEQRDAETVDENLGVGRLPSYAVANSEIVLPPVVTKTWFHTGAYKRGRDLYDAYEAEWYSPSATTEPRLSRPAVEGDDELETALELTTLSPVECHQAHRAFAGSMLRQEVYAEDGSADEDKPYVVTQETHRVRPLQPAEGAPYAAFLPIQTETLSIHYERFDSTSTPPRISHELTVAVDALGYPTKRATVAYGHPTGADYSEQEDTWITTTEDTVFHKLDTTTWYRHGVPLESQSWELFTGSGGHAPADDIFTIAEIQTAWSDTEIDYDVALAATKKRLLSHTKEKYYKDDLTAALAFGSVESLALPYQSYAKALTAAMRTTTLQNKVTTTMVADQGGYEDLDSDGDYWAKTGVQHYDSAAFYLVDKISDVFTEDTTITYDTHKLFVTKITDAVSSEVSAAIDYRVLAPDKITDINDNFVEAAFDELGRVTKTAVAGKNSGEGDTLTDPTTKLTYELDRYATSGDPSRVKTELRENHGGTATWLESYAYSDGSGNAIMTKVRAEPGDAPELDLNGDPVFSGGELQYANADPRWVGSGRTIFDNKGNPVKQYEPYFSATHEYEDDPNIVEWGATPYLQYDPLGRLIRVDLPHGSYSKIEFDPWQQTTHDGNDTAKAGQEWYDYATALPSTDPEHKAADKANAHANTPTKTYFDPLGRAFVVVEDNDTETIETKSVLDIQGNTLRVVDALSRDCMVHTYGMLGQVLKLESIDAGDRGRFDTAAGEPVKWWGERGFTHRQDYDAIRRPLKTYMDDGVTEVTVEERTYGEGHVSEVAYNTRGQLVEILDQSGELVTEQYDFKGNLLVQERTLATDYQNVLDWDAGTQPTLETETFTHEYAYDALNRPTSVITPEVVSGKTSETIPTYNVAGLLEKVEVKVFGATTATDFVTSIEYDEKGRRTKIVYDNDTEAEYTYDPLTYRLSHFKTTRTTDTKLLQSMAYYYDAVGNIVEVVDTATQSVYFTTSPTPANADADYTYDAVYRLIVAEGREHAGTNLDTQFDDLEDAPYAVPHPNSPNGFRGYKETYVYDKVGNFSTFKHEATSSPTAPTWTRTYTYVTGTNQLDTTSHSSGTKNYPRDVHGNITAMAHLNTIVWDSRDQMRKATVTTGQDVYFVYDAMGERRRKVYIHSGLKEERLYLDGYEIYRKHTISPASLDDERETLHISDDARRICMVETLTLSGGTAPSPITPRYRFQYDNHLGTACVECDTSGGVISYEEYHPYGTSSFRAFQSAYVSAKRYRYTGKERDEETRLYYHGARYYAPWLGRWMNPDPSGLVDGPNVFAYVRGSPVVMHDPNGREGTSLSEFPKPRSLLGRLLFGEDPKKLKAVLREPQRAGRQGAVRGQAVDVVPDEQGPDQHLRINELNIRADRAQPRAPAESPSDLRTRARGASLGALETLTFGAATLALEPTSGEETDPDFQHYRYGAQFLTGLALGGRGGRPGGGGPGPTSLPQGGGTAVFGFEFSFGTAAAGVAGGIGVAAGVGGLSLSTGGPSGPGAPQPNQSVVAKDLRQKISASARRPISKQGNVSQATRKLQRRLSDPDRSPTDPFRGAKPKDASALVDDIVENADKQMSGTIVQGSVKGISGDLAGTKGSVIFRGRQGVLVTEAGEFITFLDKARPWPIRIGP